MRSTGWAQVRRSDVLSVRVHAIQHAEGGCACRHILPWILREHDPQQPYHCAAGRAHMVRMLPACLHKGMQTHSNLHVIFIADLHMLCAGWASLWCAPVGSQQTQHSMPAAGLDLLLTTPALRGVFCVLQCAWGVVGAATASIKTPCECHVSS